MSQLRPTISNGKTGVGNFGIGIMPDGTSNTLRVLIKPDGFHFEPYDFDDLVWRCCQDYGQVFSTPQGAATPKNFQNPDFSLKWRDFWVFL